jgi:hypothetical protein
MEQQLKAPPEIKKVAQFFARREFGNEGARWRDEWEAIGLL